MLYSTAIIDYSPQQVLWAMALHNGASSYNSDNKYYEEIRDWAFNSAGWKFTPKGDYVYINIPQDKINKAIIVARGYRGTFIHENAKENCQVNLTAKGVTILADSIINMQALGLTDSEIRIIFSSVMKQAK